jgi:hypothetical protein
LAEEVLQYSAVQCSVEAVLTIKPLDPTRIVGPDGGKKAAGEML